jgi:hypothetical protein
MGHLLENIANYVTECGEYTTNNSERSYNRRAAGGVAP